LPQNQSLLRAKKKNTLKSVPAVLETWRWVTPRLSAAAARGSVRCILHLNSSSFKRSGTAWPSLVSVPTAEPWKTLLPLFVV